MITNIEAISQQDAAVTLRLRLGSIRVWPAYLADNIRGKQDVNGYTLLPCAYVAGNRGKCPVYERTAVLKFIEDVLASTPEAGPSKVKVTTLAIDSALPWRANKFDRAGKPVVRKCSIYPGRSEAGAVSVVARWGSFCKPTRTPIPTRRGSGLSAPDHH